MAVVIEQSITAKGSGTSVVLPSWTVATDELLLVLVTLRDESITPTVSGNGVTWVSIINLDNAQGQCGLNVFRAMPSAGATGSITVTVSGNSLPVVCFAARFSGVATGSNGANAIDATATNAGPPVTDNDDMLQSITTIADNDVIVAVGTHRLGIFTVPAGESALIINEAQGAGGDETTSSWWRKTGTQTPPGAFEMGAANDLDSARDWCMAVLAVKPTAAQTFNQAVAGTLTSSGALTKRVGKSLSGTLTSSGALMKQVGKDLAGTFTSAGALTKRVGKGVAGVLNEAGQLTNQAQMSLTAALTSAGAVTKQIGKQLAGTATFSGALTAVRVVIVILAGTLTSSGALTKSVLKQLAGTLIFSGDLTKSVAHALDAMLTSAGTLTNQVGKGLAALFDSMGNLTREAGKSLAGTLVSESVLTKQVSKFLAGVFKAPGTFQPTAFQNPPGFQTGPAGLTGTVTKQVNKALAGTLTLAGALTRQANKALAGTLTLVGVLTKTISRIGHIFFRPILTLTHRFRSTLGGSGRG